MPLPFELYSILKGVEETCIKNCDVGNTTSSLVSNIIKISIS